MMLMASRSDLFGGRWQVAVTELVLTADPTRPSVAYPFANLRNMVDDFPPPRLAWPRGKGAYGFHCTYT